MPLGTCVPQNALGSLTSSACLTLSLMQRWGGSRQLLPGRVSWDPSQWGADADQRGRAVSGLCRSHFGAVCAAECRRCAIALPENV